MKHTLDNVAFHEANISQCSVSMKQTLDNVAFPWSKHQPM